MAWRSGPEGGRWDRGAFALSDRDLDPLGPRVRHRRRLPWLRIVLGSSAAIALLTAYAEERAPRPPARIAAAAPPAELPPLKEPSPPAWTADSRAPLYQLAAEPEAGWRRSSRRHLHGAREESFTRGSLTDPALHARLSLIRAEEGIARQPSFYLELVRRAAELGVAVVRLGRLERVESQFGLLETATATLLSDGVERPCQAFRFTVAEIGFHLDGWICAPPGGEAALSPACLVDGIRLSDEADDALKLLFAQAERRRSGRCDPPRRTSGRSASPGGG
jgi:hypothetical protein